MLLFSYIFLPSFLLFSSHFEYLKSSITASVIQNKVSQYMLAHTVMKPEEIKIILSNILFLESRNLIFRKKWLYQNHIDFKWQRKIWASFLFLNSKVKNVFTVYYALDSHRIFTGLKKNAQSTLSVDFMFLYSYLIQKCSYIKDVYHQY